jgi:hypothetical protein
VNGKGESIHASPVLLSKPVHLKTAAFLCNDRVATSQWGMLPISSKSFLCLIKDRFSFITSAKPVLAGALLKKAQKMSLTNAYTYRTEKKFPTLKKLT